VPVCEEAACAPALVRPAGRYSQAICNVAEFSRT